MARDLALRGASVALLEKGDFASGDHVQVLEAHPRRAAVPRAVRLASRARVPAREEDARAPGASPRAPAARSSCPCIRGSKRGLITVRIGMWLYDLLTPGKVADRYRVMRPGRGAVARADVSGPTICAARATTRTTCCCSPSGSASRTSCPRSATAPARTTTARSKRSCAAATASRACASGTCSPAQVLDDPRARRDQLRGALGGPAARAGRARRGAGREWSGPRRASIACSRGMTERAVYLPASRRPDGLRHSVAGFLPGGHDGHGLRRRSRPPLGDARAR